jgi:hypothetical protein
MWTLLLLTATFTLAVAAYIKRYGKPANFPPGQSPSMCGEIKRKHRVVEGKPLRCVRECVCVCV